MLLLKSPGRFDRIEVRRIRRVVDEPYTGGFAEHFNLRIVMGLRVVHHNDVAASQLREQFGFHPRNEALGIRRIEHCCEQNPARKSNRSDQGEALSSPVHGYALLKLAAAFDPSVAPRHRAIEASLVEEDETANRDLANRPYEGLSFNDNVRPKTLQRPAAFFLTT
jgi:hypothetical protein